MQPSPQASSRALAGALVLTLAVATSGARAEHPAPRGTAPLASLRDFSASVSAAGAEGRSEIDDEPAPAPRSRKVDLSRFSDGPRWVPAPRGRAQIRAEELGIGTHDATIKLLRNGAWPELRAVVGEERPSTLLWPVPGGHPGRGFGFTRRIRTDLRHNGVDIGAPKGTAVRAAEAGLVVYSDNTLKGYGNAVIVLHGGGLMTLYAHNLRTTVQPGWFVERGERIALLGETGYAWGPHLHFELRDGYRPIDPKRMIRGFHSDEIAGPLAELEATTPPKAAASKPAASKPAARGAPAPVAPPIEEEEKAEVAPIKEKEKAEPGAPAPTEATPPGVEDDALHQAQQLLRGDAPAVDLAQLGRTFRTLLFPLKGGRVARSAAKVKTIDLSAELGAGVRAAADGLVVFSGRGLRADDAAAYSVVLLHADGTCSVYRADLTDAIASGTRVQRGQWLGKLASPRLRFEWRSGGQPVDPKPAFVGLDAAPALASN